MLPTKYHWRHAYANWWIDINIYGLGECGLYSVIMRYWLFIGRRLSTFPATARFHSLPWSRLWRPGTLAWSWSIVRSQGLWMYIVGDQSISDRLISIYDCSSSDPLYKSFYNKFITFTVVLRLFIWFENCLAFEEGRHHNFFLDSCSQTRALTGPSLRVWNYFHCCTLNR